MRLRSAGGALVNEMEPRAGFEPAISSCLAPKGRYQGDALAKLSHRGKQHYNILTQILILPWNQKDPSQIQSKEKNQTKRM